MEREALKQKIKEEKLKALEEKKKQKEEERLEKEKQRLEREAIKAEKERQKKEEKVYCFILAHPITGHMNICHSFVVCLETFQFLI